MCSKRAAIGFLATKLTVVVVVTHSSMTNVEIKKGYTQADVDKIYLSSRNMKRPEVNRKKLYFRFTLECGALRVAVKLIEIKTFDGKVQKKSIPGP